MTRLAIKGLEEKKANDIRILDIEKISTLADYFIIANGTNDSQVHAMVDSVEEELEKPDYTLKQRRRLWTWKLGVIGLRRSDCSCL